jgi:aldehyde:ferredoxin oxidoreductase
LCYSANQDQEGWQQGEGKMLDYKSLKVNLSTGEIKSEPIDKEAVKDFLGGRGLGVYHLYTRQAPGVDPLGEHNNLFLMTGPLAGGPAQSTSRWMAVTKSPLTGAYARAVGGADFGAWLKFSGYEFIQVVGKARKPVYIHLTADSCQIMDAADLWGKDINQTQDLLQQKHGKNTRSACIGIAGEKLVRYAGIFSAKRSASRCGVGTVMGSKNLKAVAITTQRNMRYADEAAFRQAAKEQIAAYQTSPAYKSHADMGTTDTQSTTNTLGIFPTKNFREGRLTNWEKTITGQDYRKIRTGTFGCYSCPAYCGKAHTVPGGPYAGICSDGPEYESIWSFTGPIGSTDITASVAADALCDDLGLDTISAGNCAGFAFELYEKGIITKSDTGGLELTWGNHGAMVELLKKIGNREGIGNVLAEGVKRAADIIGKDAVKYAIHCKGMEPPAYEPRGAKNMGFNYATANIGASHCYGYAAQDVWGAPFPRKVNRFEEGNADIVVLNQNNAAKNEIGICCAFSAGWGWHPDIYGKLLAASTGVQECLDPNNMSKVGERILNMERAFNVREGLGRKDDSLPERMYKENLIVDGAPIEAARVKDMQGFLDRYYNVRGWTSDGAPTPEKLKELGISYLFE